MALRKAKFQIDGIEGEFEGYVLDEGGWNGFACPGFTYKEANRLLTALNATPDLTAYFERMGAAVRVEDRNEDSPEVFEHVVRETEDDRLVLYPIGAWGWCWSEVEDEQD